MRKIAFILAFLCCLVGFTDRGAAPALHSVRPPAAGYATSVHRAAERPLPLLSSGRTVNDQWRCEREYNSDLNLPRLAPDASPAGIAAPQSRNVNPASGREWQQHAAAARSAGLMKTTSCFVRNLLSAAPHGVDYYVYRLRRLII